VKQINNTRMFGSILIMTKSYAVVKIDNYSTLSLPLASISILRVLGLTLKNPTMHQTIRYDKCEGLWYPKYFEMKAKAILIKHHLFKADEIFINNLLHAAVINQIHLKNFNGIDPENEYTSSKKMCEQVKNSENISWKEMNKL